jgi:hypothetical protein
VPVRGPPTLNSSLLRYRVHCLWLASHRRIFLNQARTVSGIKKMEGKRLMLRRPKNKMAQG